MAAQAALEALRALPFGPGEESVIVCNDWHTALLPVLIKACALRSSARHWLPAAVAAGVSLS